jgi:hypothetical protein
MSFPIPTDLTDPMVRDFERLPHGEAMKIDVLTVEIDKRKAAWLALHPGWSFHASDLVRCSDGTPFPAYDVCLGFQRPRTAKELEGQAKEREKFVARRQADYLRREDDQKALLREVLSSFKKKTLAAKTGSDSPPFAP